MFGRRTKIVATLGPATDPPGVLDRLVEAGVNCARLNCSHGTHDDLRASLRPLLDLPVELVLVSHGRPLLSDGREALAAVL